MKRILCVCLLALLLCGCTEVPQEETAAPSTAEQIYTEPTEPAGIYVSGSDLELQTGGTVRCFLPGEDCYGIRMMGSDILVFSGPENTTLTRYAGELMYAVASARLDCHIMPEESSFQISANGITYYDPDSREVVFLDNDLKEVRRLGMSSDMVGKPILSGNRMQVFYCTAEAVRVYDMATGLDKLLKTISYSQQSVEELLLNDSLLRCSLMDENGETYSVFFSAQTGQLATRILSDIEVSTYGDAFYAKCPEGIQKLLVFGHQGEEPLMLTPADPFAESWYLEEDHALITATVDQELTILDYYDLSTGLRASSVELPQGIVPRDVEYRSETGEILICAINYQGKIPVILCWNKDADPVADETVYTGPRYTAEDPDVNGLNACALYAQQLEEAYNVDIRLAEEAIACQPQDYILELEYQPTVIQKQLETLETALSQFPEGFFDKFQRKITICIVRSIRGNAKSGSVESAQGVQFWDNNNPYVALAAGDTLAGAFYHEFFHVIDSRVLSNTRIYYHWNNLNPKGCQYFEDYTSYLEADVSQYLQEEDRAFIDAYSMCYPKEDRARIMEYACQEGNAHYFQSEVMQNKLKTLCEGIRKAFALEKYPDSFLWEQYLNEPLKLK